MKKFLFLMVLNYIILSFVSCGPSAKEMDEQRMKQDNSTPPNGVIGTVQSNGCDYFNFQGYYDHFYTHRGDCRNPIHKNYENIQKYKLQRVQDSLTIEKLNSEIRTQKVLENLNSEMKKLSNKCTKCLTDTTKH